MPRVSLFPYLSHPWLTDIKADFFKNDVYQRPDELSSSLAWKATELLNFPLEEKKHGPAGPQPLKSLQ